MANFTCPIASSGDASWHACASGSRFVGCCASADPCALGCSAGNLAAASFNAEALYGKIPDLECGQSARFYTCRSTDPPFWGCCKSDPCAGGGEGGGCPREDLSPAYLGANPQATVFYSPTGAVLTPSSSSSSPSSSPAPASTSASPVPADAHSNSTVIAAAVGGVVGGVLLAVLLMLLFWFRLRRRRRSSAAGWGARFEVKKAGRPEGGEEENAAAVNGRPGSFFGQGPPSHLQSLPPQQQHQQQRDDRVFELESRTGVAARERGSGLPVELMAEPVVPAELDAAPVAPPSRGSDGEGSAGSVLSSVKHQQCTLEPVGVEEPQVSPQSATFDPSSARNLRDSGVSSLATVPHTPLLSRRSLTPLEDGD